MCLSANRPHGGLLQLSLWVVVNDQFGLRPVVQQPVIAVQVY